LDLFRNEFLAAFGAEDHVDNVADEGMCHGIRPRCGLGILYGSFPRVETRGFLHSALRAFAFAVDAVNLQR
jgi:hypothetical protein